MKKRLLALGFVFVFLLAGCGKEEAKKKVTPTSEVYADSSEVEETAEEQATKYEVSGGDSIMQALMEEDTADKENVMPSQVTANTMPRTTDTAWDSYVTTTSKGGAQKEADLLRNSILTTKNTADYYTWTGRTFYVSPTGNDENDGLTPETAIQSMAARAVLKSTLKAGDAILFERGGEWRMTSSISTKGGVTYGCYGDTSKEKPTFLGSPYNYANPDYWTPSSRANIWKLNVADDDIGLVVFNNGEEVGYKRMNGLTSLDKNFDYYYNNNEDILYLYLDKGNPGRIYNDIEVCFNKTGFGIGSDNVTIDNLRIKYYGRFGVATCGNNFTNITNCEIGYIGGAIQSGTLRYGNGIQQWNSVDTLTISNCWVYQSYDTAITFQGSDSYEVGKDADGYDRIGDKAYYKDISFIGNLLEYNVYAYEMWHHATTEGIIEAQIPNLKVTDNICRFSGHQWSAKQRPDKVGSEIYGGKGTYWKNAKNCVISNNIFDCSSRMIVLWTFNNKRQGNYDISNNTFYFHNTIYGEAFLYGSNSLYASGIEQLKEAVNCFDEMPKKVQYIFDD